MLSFRYDQLHETQVAKVLRRVCAGIQLRKCCASVRGSETLTLFGDFQVNLDFMPWQSFGCVASFQYYTKFLIVSITPIVVCRNSFAPCVKIALPDVLCGHFRSSFWSCSCISCLHNTGFAAISPTLNSTKWRRRKFAGRSGSSRSSRASCSVSQSFLESVCCHCSYGDSLCAYRPWRFFGYLQYACLSKR